jgi:hypothetical protein
LPQVAPRLQNDFHVHAWCPVSTPLRYPYPFIGAVLSSTLPLCFQIVARVLLGLQILARFSGPRLPVNAPPFPLGLQIVAPVSILQLLITEAINGAQSSPTTTSPSKTSTATTKGTDHGTIGGSSSHRCPLPTQLHLAGGRSSSSGLVFSFFCSLICSVLA